MSYTITDRTIAIAGIYQAVHLVQQIANTGTVDEQDFETCIQSIFCVDMDKTADTFGDQSNISTGLRALIEQLGGQSGKNEPEKPKDMYITKYAIGAMVLEKQLKKNPDMLDEISTGIERARNQAEHFSMTHDNVIASLADLYTKTISTLKPRIMVHGEQLHISNPNQTNKIRALLLAAIRAVVLWRQCGGTRWQLIFQRQSIIDAAQTILNDSQG